MTKRTRRYRKRGGGQVPPLQTYGYQHGASSPQQNAMLQQKQAAAEQNALNNKHGGGKRRRTRRRTRRRKAGMYSIEHKRKMEELKTRIPLATLIKMKQMSKEEKEKEMLKIFSRKEFDEFLKYMKDDAERKKAEQAHTRMKIQANRDQMKQFGGYQYKQLGGRIVVPQSDNAPPSAGPVDGNSLAVGGAENLTQNNENAKYDDVNAPAKVTTVAGGGRKKKRRKTRKHRKTRGKYGYNQRGCSRNGKKKSRRRSKRRNSKRFITGGKRRRSKGKGGYAAQLWGCFS